jgi:hypothetical protein
MLASLLYSLACVVGVGAVFCGADLLMRDPYE